MFFKFLHPSYRSKYKHRQANIQIIDFFDSKHKSEKGVRYAKIFIYL